MSTKSKCLLVLILLVVLGATHFWALRPGQDWGGDFGMYISHAKNLAEGVPYSETGYIYNPGYATVGPSTYPPGCPVMLAPVYMLYGLNYEAMKVLMLGLLLVFLLFVFLSFQMKLPFWHAVAVTALVGLNRAFLGEANHICSDLPFLAVLYLTIFVILKAYDTVDTDNTTNPPRLGYMAAAGVLMFFSFTTRTLGIVLLPSLLLYELWHYRRITRGGMLAAAIFVSAAVAQSLLLAGNASYLDQYNVPLSLFVKNDIAYLKEFAGFWHNGYFKPAGGVLFLALSALAVLGYVSDARRKITFLEIFPIFYVAMVFLFPGYAGKRYLLPIFPIYLLFVARALEHAWLTERAKLRRAVFAVFAIAIVGSYGASYTKLDLDMTEGVSKPESIAMLDHIAHQTDEDDVMIFIKPRVMALLTSRRTSVYHMPDEDSELRDYFDQIGATHLVVVENDAALARAEEVARLKYLRDFAERNAEHLTPVFENADFSIYRIAARD